MPFANIDNNVARGGRRGGGFGRFGVAGTGPVKRLRQTVGGARKQTVGGARKQTVGGARKQPPQQPPQPQQQQRRLQILTKTNTSVAALPPAPSSNTPTPTAGFDRGRHEPVASSEARFLEVANEGQRRGRRATLTSEGCGGAYYVQDASGVVVGVWKPRNEEPFAPSNPRGYVDANIRCGSRSPMRPGFRVGWGFLREHAVYRLDMASALRAGVPLTASVSASPLGLTNNYNPSAASSSSSSALLSPLPTTSLARSASAGFLFDFPSKRLTRSPSVPPSFVGSPIPSSSTSSSSSSTFSATTTATTIGAGNASATSYPPMTFTVVGSTNASFAGDLGSLQQFVPHAGTLEDHGTSGLSKLQCQIIATLDVRIMNADRHGANILVTDHHQGTSRNSSSSASVSRRGLVPIDHGFALPPCFEERAATANAFGGTTAPHNNSSSLAGTTFIWQGFRQCRDPILPQVQRFIQGLDLPHDAQLLRACGIENEAILTNRIGTALLQRGAAAGLSLSEIASLCLRVQGNSSLLERHVQAARRAVRAHRQVMSRHCANCTFGESTRANCACGLCQTFDHIDFDALVGNKS
jgi:hypothetical protein